MPSQKQIREEITHRIVAAIEQGVLPWRRPWRVSPNAGRPANVISRNTYNGVNPLLLEIAAMEKGFSSKWWGTFRQWSELGCQVQRRPDSVEPGNWGTKIVFASKVKKEAEDPDTEPQEFFLLKTYTVFNGDQVEGAERFQVTEEPAVLDEISFAPAEDLIVATGADIRHGGERAFYSPGGDYIQVPNRERFSSLGSYYETALHELSHWSEPRQNFDRNELGYALCELIAEMSACFVASEIGIPHGEGLENHASYLKAWLDQMKGDSSFIFKASKLASGPCDYLLSFVREPVSVE